MRLPEFTDTDWTAILRRVRKGGCVPFLGAGASMGFNGQPGLPTGSQLAEALAADCDYPGRDRTDFLRVAQYYETQNDPALLRDFIISKLSVPGVKPGVVHSTLASLPFRYFLTTNFDTLMEQAFQANPALSKSAQAFYYERYGTEQVLPAATIERPVLFKLHGAIEQTMSMIVTEDDVVDFLSCILLQTPKLPDTVKTLLKDSSLLFVGYSLKDWNVRVLLRAIRGARGNRSGITSYAVQRKPPDVNLAIEWENSAVYWLDRERVKCCDMDAVGFITELKRRFDAGEGQ